MPCLRQPIAHPLADKFLQPIGQDVGSIGPFGLPHRLPHLVLDANHVLHRVIATAERLDEQRFTDLIRPSLDHQQRIGGAGHPQIERTVLHLRDGRGGIVMVTVIRALVNHAWLTKCIITSSATKCCWLMRAFTTVTRKPFALPFGFAQDRIRRMTQDKFRRGINPASQGCRPITKLS